MPITNLGPQHFTLKVDGKPTPITYFRKEGDARRPLLLLVALSLAPEGALRDLLTPAASRSFQDALAQLHPDDEVAVLSVDDWFAAEPRLLSPPTRDRSSSAAAFSLAIGNALSQSPSSRRDNRSPNARSMSSLVAFASSLSSRYPHHQTSLVWISDGMNTLDLFESRERNLLLDQLDSAALTFNSIHLPMLASYAAAATVLNPMGKLFGLQFTGSTKQFAKHTGGIAEDIPAASDLASALSHILAAHTARYSLGFALPNTLNSENWHKLDLKLDSAYPLLISARRRFSTRRIINSAEFSLPSPN